MTIRKLACLAAVAMLIVACSKKDAGKGPGFDAPLHYAPAGSAYVLGNLEPAPDSFIALAKRWNAALSDGVLQSIDRALEKTSQIQDAEKARRAKELLTLLRDTWNEDAAALGLDYKARSALYEINALPVLRFELADPAKFKAFIAKLETRNGKPFATATVDGQSYWRFPLNETAQQSDAELIFAIVGKHAVAALHAPAAGASVQALLGLQKPAKSILDTGELQAVNKEFGLQPYGTLLVRPRALAEQFIGQPKADTWLSRAAAAKGKGLNEVCRTEISALAGKIPRLVGGYTKLDGQNLETNYVLELEPALAKSLSELPAPVPGLGSGAGNVEFGIGLDLNKLATFVQAQASAIQAAPFQCEQLQSWNAAAAQAPQQLAGLHMAAGWVNGLRANLTELDIDNARVQGTLLLTSPNPAGLLGMAQGFVPQLAQLNLAPGAEPQQLDSRALPIGDALGGNQELWVATSDKAVGIAIGANGKQALKSDLQAAAPQPAPLLYTHFSGAFYAKFIQDVNQQIENALPQQDDASYILEPLQRAVPAIYKDIESDSARFLLTAKGLEMRGHTRIQKQ